MLYYDDKEGVYYWIGIQKCHLCKTDILEYIFIYNIWDKYEIAEQYYCQNCISKRVKGYECVEIKQALIIEEIKLPITAKLYLNIKPELGGNATVFIGATSNKGCISDTSKTVVIDNTKWVNVKDRNVMPGALEHRGKVLEDMKFMDKPLLDTDTFLMEVQNSTAVLPGSKDKILLGGGKNGRVKQRKRRSEMLRIL